MSGFPKNRSRQLKPIPEPEPVGPGHGGRPVYEPTQEERRVVRLAAAVGIPQDQIAKHLNDGNGICKMTLQKYFRKELNEGMWEANMEAVGCLLDTIKNCKDLKVRQRALEFWLDRRMQEYFAAKGLQPNEPNKLVITVEGGLPTIEHSAPNGNGIDLDHGDSESTD